MNKFRVALSLLFCLLPGSAAVNGICARELEEFKTFASSLSPNYWGTNFRHTHGQFDDYIDKFSDLMKRCNSLFQFISVGACDGTSDPAIASFYDRKHWNAVFVEASPPNIGFLKEKIIEKEVSGRSIVMHVAAMEVCKSPTVEFARPIVENEKAQHWLRRQVGRVPDKENAIEFFKKNPKKWAVDTVRCLTGSHIVSEWERTSPLSTKTPGISHRAHLLKIDVEGASFGVLKSFMSNDFPVEELPIFVMAEIKTAPGEIEKACEEARSLLESRGYIPSKCGQDIFAMLRPEHIIL